MRSSRSISLLFATLLALAACGGGDTTGSGPDPTQAATGATQGQSQSDDSSDGADDSADGNGNQQVPQGGGGGLLIFDGEEIPIESVHCSFWDDEMDVVMISGSGHQVLIDWNPGAEAISVAILDFDDGLLQWFPLDVTGDEAKRNDNTFTSEPTLYFNNRDDREVEASFTVECP